MAEETSNEMDLQTSLSRMSQSLDRIDKTAMRVLAAATRGQADQEAIEAYTQAAQHHRQKLQAVREAAERQQAKLEQLNEMVRTTALVTSTLDIDEVLDEVMDTIVALVGAERVYLMLYSDEGEFELRAARNWDNETLSEGDIGLSQSIVNAAIENNQPIITTNAQQDTRFAGQDSIMMQKLRSIICVPLSLAGKVMGVLYADNRYRLGAFDDDMAPVLAAFGTQAAIAIMNAQVFTQVKTNLDKAQEVIRELQIQIDTDRRDQQVEEITETGFFKELTEAAQEMRRRQKRSSDANEN